MNKKILFFTFFVLVILMIIPYTSSINICKGQQNFGEKSKVRSNKNLNENNYIIKPFAIFFLYGQIEGLEINEYTNEGGNWTEVIFYGINVLYMYFAHLDEFPWWFFHIEKIIDYKYTISFVNDILEFKGTFKDNFLCGFIIARPII